MFQTSQNQYDNKLQNQNDLKLQRTNKTNGSAVKIDPAKIATNTTQLGAVLEPDQSGRRGVYNYLYERYRKTIFVS